MFSLTLACVGTPSRLQIGHNLYSVIICMLRPQSAVVKFVFALSLTAIII